MADEKPTQVQRSWLRYFSIFVVAIVTTVLGYALVRASPQGLSNPSSLLATLAWVALIIIAILFFEVSIAKLLDSLTRKIDSAVSVTFPGIVINASVERIPIPQKTQAVTLDNIALLHTSFVRPDKTREFNDGMNYYQIEVILVAPAPVLDRVEEVTYHLDEVYPSPIRVVTDRRSRFKLKELANGTSIVRAVVKFHEQPESLELNRFIDLRPEGPRI